MIRKPAGAFVHIRRLIFTVIVNFVPLAASPVLVTIRGNFGPSSGATTVFDSQDYEATFLIPDPTNPIQSIGDPVIDFFSVNYIAMGSLTVPGIALSTQEPTQAGFIKQSGATWLNAGPFLNIPVGVALLATPVRTLNGTPLWNGLAGAAGTPAIYPLNSEAVWAYWRLQQLPPGQPVSIPLAEYQSGTPSISIVAVPEPATAGLLLAGLLIIRARRSA